MIIRPEAYSPISGELRPSSSAVFVAEAQEDLFWRMVLPFTDAVNRLPDDVSIQFIGWTKYGV